MMRAEHALAVSHSARAARAWAQNEMRRAAAELRAAARHAEQAAIWLSGTLEARLREHAVHTPSDEELFQGVSALAQRIVEIGRRITGRPEPAPPSPP